MSNLGDLGGFIDENWHGGQIKGDFFDHPEMHIEENKTVARKKTASVWNWKHVITRELMRGHHKKDILFKFQSLLNKFNLMEKAVDFINKYDGILGYFIVDVSNFDSKFTYNDIPSFMRECNLYAINANELREIISRSLMSANDGSLDGFLGANDNINEEVTYIDEYTGLPCIDKLSDADNEDERLEKIANLFVNQKIMSIAEKNAFDMSANKLKFLINLLKKSFEVKSNANGKFENDTENYDLNDYDLQADSQKAQKDVEIKNLREIRTDDIGNVSMPQKVKTDKLQENKINVELNPVSKPVQIEKIQKKSDFKQDVDLFNKKEFNINDNIHELKKEDFKSDVDVDKVVVNEEVGKLKENPIAIENIPVFKKVEVEPIFKKSDFKTDVQFDDNEEFVIEDLKDMKDDEFDYADLSKGDVNLDEMFDEESDKNEVDIEHEQEEFEIDGKSDWVI